MTPTSFTLYIQKEISKFRSVLPILKSCRGDAFSDEHWAELFVILDLKKINLDTLTFGHLLGATDQLLSKATMIKVRFLSIKFHPFIWRLSQDLAGWAQAEVSIREALRELEIWGATASFHLTAYKESANTEVSTVKDWNELLPSVRFLKRYDYD